MEANLPSPAEHRPIRSASCGGEAHNPPEFVDPGPRQDVFLSETIPLAAQSPPQRALSHTPPLLPAHFVENDVCHAVAVDPLQEFSVTARHTVACDRCLAAACSLLRFDIAEVWTYTGDYSAVEGKAVEPLLLHVYTTPATIETFGGKLQGVWSGDGNGARHSLSPMLVDKARKEEDVLWYTSTNPDTPLHVDLSLNTAVALPVSLDAFHRDLCFVFFADNEFHRQDAAVSVLTQLSKAAGLAMSSAFPAVEVEDTSVSDTSMAPASVNTEMSSVQRPLEEEVPFNDNVRWDELRDVEFMVNGSRCTIYTAFYGSIPVVAKVMRKDVQDKEVVQQELELEMGLLMRLRHPNIVKLIGAGTQPEHFLLIERLDGGTLAQRCHNALNIRDRRRRFRHKRPFTYEDILRHGVQMADALQYMHNDAIPGKLVVHRDLKPDNIGFDLSGNLKLIDLGLGRVMTKASEENAVYEMTGETGSLRYMAPEVARSAKYNGSADVYGFAIILWEMATMTKPFEALGREEFFRDVVGRGVRPYLSKKWPPEFCKLLTACWHADMNQRPCFKEVKATLGRLLNAAAASAAQARSVPGAHHRKFGLFKGQSKKGTMAFS